MIRAFQFNWEDFYDKFENVPDDNWNDDDEDFTYEGEGIS